MTGHRTRTTSALGQDVLSEHRPVNFPITTQFRYMIYFMVHVLNAPQKCVPLRWKLLTLAVERISWRGQCLPTNEVYWVYNTSHVASSPESDGSCYVVVITTPDAILNVRLEPKSPSGVSNEHTELLFRTWRTLKKCFRQTECHSLCDFHCMKLSVDHLPKFWCHQ